MPIPTKYLLSPKTGSVEKGVSPKTQLQVYTLKHTIS